MDYGMLTESGLNYVEIKFKTNEYYLRLCNRCILKCWSCDDVVVMLIKNFAFCDLLFLN